MRFVIKNTNTPTTNIRVPVQVNTSLIKLKQAMEENFPYFKYGEYPDKSFDYRITIKKEEKIKSILYARISRPSYEEKKTVAKYLGPKGLEIQVYCTNDNDKEARTLLEKILTLLPITEMEPKKTDENALYHTIVEWYFHQTKEQHDIETSINEALKDVQFPPKNKTGNL